MREKLLPYVSVVYAGDGAYSVFLKVDHQSFCLTPDPCESLEQATWFRDQLLIALERMVRQLTERG